MRVPGALQPQQHLVLLVFLILFIPREFKIISWLLAAAFSIPIVIIWEVNQ